MGMITYDQLSKIIREQLAILFPDKHISSGEATSKDMNSYEMQFHIVVKPGEPHLILGFTKEADSSMINIWNGKRENKVIDIDTDDNFIRRYHEPKLYAESSICLGYSQVGAIYTALDTFLNCDDIVDERSVKYDPAISLEQIQTVIERWMKSNDIRGNACESEAGRFYYDLWEGKFIKGTLISAGDEKEILIWMNTDTPVMKITPSISSLIQSSVPSFTDKEVYDLYNEISEAAVLSEEKKDNESSEEENLDKFSVEFSEGYKNYLNSLSHKKKHPLQDSPTFPEEVSAEREMLMDQSEEKEYSVPVEKFNKPIDPFKMVPIFNVDAFEVGYPYLLNKAHNDVVITNKHVDELLKISRIYEKTNREQLKW